MAKKRDVDELSVERTYFDAEGKRTEDVAQAVRGEVVARDAENRRSKRTWFFLEEVEIKWLPVSEGSFLLWVLGLLLVIWLGIGFALGLT
jgi:hypothetical protein